MIGTDFLLWENDSFILKTPSNPHIPYTEGLHIIAASKKAFEAAWSNPDISAEAFRISANACKIIEETAMAPWFNIQANGNWGLLRDGQKFFHIHIYGRNKTENWGKPIVLPALPGTYHNDPMPESDRDKLIEAFKRLG